MVSRGYQPPLFDFQEDEVTVPSVCCCRTAMRQVRAALMCSSLQSQRQANCQSSSSFILCRPENLVILERSPAPDRGKEAGTLVCGSLGGGEVCLRLPAPLKVHAMFNICRVKPVLASKLAPQWSSLVIPAHSGSLFTRLRVPVPHRLVTVSRRGHGYPVASSWTTI